MLGGFAPDGNGWAALTFFGGKKELEEGKGCAAYDDVKLLTEAYNMKFLFMGFGRWLKERALNKGSIQNPKPTDDETTVNDY